MFIRISNRIKQILSVVILMAFAAGLVQPSVAFAQQTVDPSFDPGMIIPDLAFADTGTFGSAAGIQTFLEQKGSVLANTSQDFLIKLKEPSDVNTKVALEDRQPNLGRLRTAAELIYDASLQHGMNSQVLLVTLQKEQSLITGTFTEASLQRGLDRALGFGCPDVGGCGDIFLGFYRQIFGTFDADGSRWLGAVASLMRSFNTEVGGVRVGRGPGVDAQGRTFGTPTVRVSRKGDTIMLDNTMGGYAGISQQQTVTIGNFATAALYRYTPHVFNGNYNFWKFYTAWFKYPNGTVIQRVGDMVTYVIDNGTKRPFSAYVATQRKIKIDAVISVSQTEFDSYPLEAQIAPLDETLLKGDVEGTVFIIQSGKKRPISYPIFVQRNYSFAKVVTLPQAEVSAYEMGTFLPPLNGSLLIGETDPTVYVIEGDFKRPITYDIFVARKYSFAKLMKLYDSEVVAFQTGPMMYPPDQVQVQLKGDAGIYWFKDGMKRYVSAFVFKQRGVGNFPMVKIGLDEFNAIPTGTPLPPKDGTFIKGDASGAIYLMQDGVKKLLTPVSYKRLRSPKPTILPQIEVDSYTEGEVIVK